MCMSVVGGGGGLSGRNKDFNVKILALKQKQKKNGEKNIYRNRARGRTGRSANANSKAPNISSIY